MVEQYDKKTASLNMKIKEADAEKTPRRKKDPWVVMTHGSL